MECAAPQSNGTYGWDDLIFEEMEESGEIVEI
jgi:hypothetical protein